MKISDLILELEDNQRTFGDLEVFIGKRVKSWNSEKYSMDWETPAIDIASIGTGVRILGITE